MRKLILLSVLLLSGLFLHAQLPEDAQDQLQKNGEVYFKFDIGSAKQIADLTKIISIDNVSGNTVFAYANAKEFAAFEALNYGNKILPHPNEGFNPTMATFEQMQNSDAWDFYPTYDAYVAMMYQFEADYPSLCDVFSIGQSVNGRELLVARISDNVGVDEDEPEFLYTSSIHGDELTGYILMLRLIDSLLTSYGTNPRITNLVNSIDIFINPLANPDGTYNGGNNTVSNAIRYNANYVDLNRNYPDPVGGPHPDGNAWQPETIAFMSFAESRHFVMAANFHGGAEVFNYPWDHKYALCADDDWWQYVGHEYADTAQAYSPSTYMNGFNDGITNGAAWYVVYGGRQDYMNYFHQCREVTIEISDTKLIPASQLPAHWEYNRRSLLNYLEQSLYGIRGLVTDANSGLPVVAEVYVLNHEIDIDSSWVYSDPITGNYHRYLNSGNYDIRFSAPCYEDQVITGINVQNHATTLVNAQLNPVTDAADFISTATVAVVGESIYFTDISCGDPFAWQWSFAGPGTPAYLNGTNATSQNPVVQFDIAGQYTVSLTITSPSGNFSITKNNYLTIQNCTYCDAFATNASEEWISNVSIHTLNNPTGGLNGYEDYTSLSADVIQEGTYNLSVSVSSTGSWTENVFAFIDWDNNCEFNQTESYDLGSTAGPGTLNTDITVPTNATEGFTRMRIILRYNIDPGSCDQFTYGEVEDYSLNIIPAGFDLDLKVYLEGAFNNTDMSTILNGSELIPLMQPYSTAPWLYPGTESVGTIPNASVTDWLLVELRDAADAGSANSGTRIARRAAFLLNDGSIVGTDGTSMLHFDLSVANQLFVILYHRNHLPVMSALPLTGTSGIYSYDFTDALSKAYLNGQKEIVSGIFGMPGGDTNADGFINGDDKDQNWTPDAGEAGYLPGDLNLNGQVNNPDKTEIWFPNFGMEAKLPTEPAKAK